MKEREMASDIRHDSLFLGISAEAKDLWMAQASPVRTAIRSSVTF